MVKPLLVMTGESLVAASGLSVVAVVVVVMVSSSSVEPPCTLVTAGMYLVVAV